jgi:hypothetical protein
MNESKSKHWALEGDNVEAYVMHRLDEKLMQEFSLHLQQCRKCRSKVQQEKDIQVGIRRFGRWEIKHRLQQQIRRDRNRRFEWTQVASVAAAVVIVVVAVFTLRWYTDIGQHKTKSREISIKQDDVSQRPLWITGRVIIQNRTFKGTISEQISSFNITQGNITKTISIRHAQLTDLPPSLRTNDESTIQTLFEKTSKGLRLTLYADVPEQTLKTGVEVISAESLIVYFRDKQIAYHIPGGWVGITN